nr:septum formation family protein [Schumannella luteola]
MARRARPSGGARAASIALSIVSIVVVGAVAITLRPGGAGSADLTRLERSGLIVGDCITQPADPAAPIEAADLPRVDCAEPHWGEVVFVGTTPGRDGLTAYPGDDWLTQDADARCARAFADYVGLPPTQSTLGRQFFVPTAEGWVQGDRGEVCAVFDPTLPSFAGSLEQVAR